MSLTNDIIECEMHSTCNECDKVADCAKKHGIMGMSNPSMLAQEINDFEEEGKIDNKESVEELLRFAAKTIGDLNAFLFDNSFNAEIDIPKMKNICNNAYTRLIKYDPSK